MDNETVLCLIRKTYVGDGGRDSIRSSLEQCAKLYYAMHVLIMHSIMQCVYSYIFVGF